MSYLCIKYLAKLCIIFILSNMTQSVINMTQTQKSHITFMTHTITFMT